jgi:DNA-binding LytR/AlgR family response regulator
VDDEPVARRGIEEYVAQTEHLHLVASCENVMKATAAMTGQHVDLLFLDIHMPRMSGIEFLKTLQYPPLTILTTAFSEYALDGYALDVVDYLLKPITFERFMRAINKALEIHRLRQHVRDPNSETTGMQPIAPYFFVKCDNRYEKVMFNEVRYIEALQNYVVIHTRDKKMITYLTLSGIEAQLPKDSFIKIHKSFVVSVNAIQAIEGSDVVVGSTRIPISRNLKDEVVARILGNNLFRRS